MKYLILLTLYLSIYQASDPTKSVIECAYDTAKSDVLVVSNKDLNSTKIDEWVMKVCKPKENL